ncbi:MAG TPA: HEPN domain-containing protein [Armatimonadota bacterium]|jgi:uncharacterized protein (UPF0332 family)
MTAEQEAYLSRAEENLKAARVLLGSGLPMVAIGRAYYAMLHSAQALLLGKGLTFSKHSAVAAAFGHHFAKPGLVPQHLHRCLLDAADMRVESDYSPIPSLGGEEASRLVAAAEEFVCEARKAIG